MVNASKHSLLAQDVTRIFTNQFGSELLVLDKVSLSVKGSEIVGIVGPSGCGKSTFLRLVAGLDKQQGGTLLYDGAPVTGPHYDRGLVFQSAALFDWLTVYENIAFGLKARKVFKGQENKVSEYIEMMGLGGFEKSYPYQISGGMASRAALARTFIQDPGLVLLDEPLSALDAFTRMAIQEEIIRMHRLKGAIYLLVTHDIEEAIYLCDRVIIMSPRPGRIIGEIIIDLPHPRDRVDDAFIVKRRDVFDRLSGVVTEELTMEEVQYPMRV
ncbi:MAG: ABC transporter ATP-binding protein [Coriobacteriales bacterium]|jgi:sulfonate transport system ATP-binding protein|nr:ABC transporter ATP-binding protein [Coriobacteriales bacterium]